MLREVTSIIRRCTHSNSGFPHPKPFTLVSVKGCVHEVCSDEPVGAIIECTQCGDLDAHKSRVQEFFDSGLLSHVTRRSCAANRCRAWESLNVYRQHPSSPTGCILEFSIPACDELEQFCASIGKRSVLGPSRGEMALL